MPKQSILLGIKPAQNAKLKKANVDSIEIQLKKGTKPKGRAIQKSISSIKPKKIHEWRVKPAGLLQIRGIGAGYSELLAKAGVKTVGKLADHDPKVLHSSLLTVNSRLGQVMRLPGPDVVKTWVGQAKILAQQNSGFGPTGPGGGRPGMRQPAALGPAGPGDGPPVNRPKKRSPG